MGWYTIASPGTECGPCIEPCEHTDCAATRKDAETLCTICGERIGYNTPVYFGKEGKHDHARCVIEREHKERNEKRACSIDPKDCPEYWQGAHVNCSKCDYYKAIEEG